MESRAIEVVVALGGIFLAYSLLVTQIGEMIAGMRASRAKFLAQGIASLVGPILGKRVLDHPLILSMGTTRGPSYVPAKYFATALLDAISGNNDTWYVEQIDRLGLPAEIAGRLKAVIGDTKVTRAEIEARLADWFDRGMERVTGVYKRHTQLVSFCLGVVLAVVTNADAIGMAQGIWTQPSVRQAAIGLSQEQLRQCTQEGGILKCPDFGVALSRARQSTPQLWPWQELSYSALAKQGIPATEWVLRWLLKVLGLLLTAIAVSMGAPFWFDLLTKLAPGFRNAGPAPASSGSGA